MGVGKKILNRLTSVDVSQRDNWFIGIVRDVVYEQGELFQSYSKNPDYEKFIDNRSEIFVTPIDDDYKTTVISCRFMNNHEMDLPLKGETVLCLVTKFGVVIIDRMAQNPFVLNYDSNEPILTGKNINPEDDIEIDIADQNGIIKEGLRSVAPFHPKMGSRVWLGRNNQYMIFDQRSRLNAKKVEREHTNEGSFVKIGFRIDGEQSDTREDPSFSVWARRANISKMMSQSMNSKFYQLEDSNYGYGVQSDDLLFIGKSFTCIYSGGDMLISAKRRLILESRELHVENRKTKIVSPDIELGENARSPVILGDVFVNEFGKDLIRLIQNAQYLTPTGTTTGPSPVLISEIQKFTAKYLRSSSKILSKNTKTK